MKSAFRWVELAPMLHARKAARAALLPDGRVLVGGGSSWSHARRTELHPGCEVLDLRNNRWENAAVLHPPPQEAAQVNLAGIALRHRRIRPNLTPLDGRRVLVTGGFETFSSFHGDDKDDSVEEVELVNLARRTSTVIGRLLHARHAHLSLLLPSGAVLITGGLHDDGSEATAKVELGLPPGVAPGDLFAPDVAAQLESQLSEQQFAARLEQIRALKQQKRLTPARRLATAATRRWPEKDDAWSQLGDVLYAQGQFARARDAYQRAVALDAECPFLWCSLAAAQLALGAMPEALAGYEKVIALTDGDDTWTWSVRKTALAQRQFLSVGSAAPAALEREAKVPASLRGAPGTG